MTTISSLPSSNSYGYNTTASYAASSPVAQTSNAGLVQTAVSLSTAGSIIASLGGGSGTLSTYDAAGLLNSLVQAGAAPSTPQTPTSNPQAAQNSTDQGIINTLGSTPSTSGIYNAQGVLQSLPVNTTSNWANILKQNPSAAALVAADSTTQAIVGTLSTIA